MKEGLATGCQDPPGEDRPVSSGRRSAGGQLVDARGRLEDCGVTVLGDDDDEQLCGNTNLLGTSNRGGNQWFGAGVQRTSQTSPEPSPGAGQTGSLVKTRGLYRTKEALLSSYNRVIKGPKNWSHTQVGPSLRSLKVPPGQGQASRSSPAEACWFESPRTSSSGAAVFAASPEPVEPRQQSRSSVSLAGQRAARSFCLSQLSTW